MDPMRPMAHKGFHGSRNGAGGFRFARCGVGKFGVPLTLTALAVFAQGVRVKGSASRFGVQFVHSVQAVHLPVRRAKRAPIA